MWLFSFSMNSSFVHSEVEIMDCCNNSPSLSCSCRIGVRSETYPWSVLPWYYKLVLQVVLRPVCQCTWLSCQVSLYQCRKFTGKASFLLIKLIKIGVYPAVRIFSTADLTNTASGAACDPRERPIQPGEMSFCWNNEKLFHTDIMWAIGSQGTNIHLDYITFLKCNSS